MKKSKLSAKRIALDKTNASLIVIVAVSVFVSVFCLVSIKALYDQLTYQSRVINQKEITLDLVQENINEVEKLNIAYQEFAGSPENVIGGNPDGKGDRDGENARIVLDALPSRYDFPALTTSLAKLVKNGGFTLVSITGTDDEVNQSENEVSVTPAPIEVPFTIESEVNVDEGKKYLELFESSIRPIKVKQLLITGQENDLSVEIIAETYYQPEKKLNVTNEVVR